MNKNVDMEIVVLSDDDDDDNITGSSDPRGTAPAPTTTAQATTAAIATVANAKAVTMINAGTTTNEPATFGVTASIINERPIDLRFLLKKFASWKHDLVEKNFALQADPFKFSFETKKNCEIVQNERNQNQQQQTLSLHSIGNPCLTVPNKTNLISKVTTNENKENAETHIQHRRPLQQRSQFVNSFDNAGNENRPIITKTELKGGKSKSKGIKKSKSFSQICVESCDRKAPKFAAVEFRAKFKCTYGNCQKILSNNINFMFHLWSHVAQHLSNGGEFQADIRHLCTCPHCLHISPNPYRLYKHYYNIHRDGDSKNVCPICEITVSVKHSVIHGSYDAPYHCRRCKFRTSCRSLFIDHFTKFHFNTRDLLCPFCLITYKVVGEASSIVRKPGYVSHFKAHLKQTRFECKRCALKFLTLSQKKAHQRDHLKLNPKWISRNFCLQQRRRFEELWVPSSHSKCIECGEDPGLVKEHFKYEYCCGKCSYKTNCYQAMGNHKFIDCCRKRVGMLRKHLLQNLVICSKCGRQSCDPEILEHIYVCGNGIALNGDEVLASLEAEQENKLFSTRFEPLNDFSKDRTDDMYDEFLKRVNAAADPDCLHNAKISFIKSTKDYFNLPLEYKYHRRQNA